MKVFKFLIFLLLCMVSASASSQNIMVQRFTPGTIEQLRVLPTLKNSPRIEELHQAALKGKSQYQLLVNESNFKALGLDRAADAASSQLGTPSKDYLVRLDKLKTFKRGDDPAKFLTDTGLVHYPIVQGNKVRSTVTLATINNHWQVVSIGDASRSLLRNEALTKSTKTLQKPEEQFFTVRIPAFNLEFEATNDSAGKLQLTPVLNAPEWGLHAGVPTSAETLFLKLVPAATAYKDLPH